MAAKHSMGSSAQGLARQLQVAAAHHQGGRAAEAEKLYREILKADPDHADALQLYGLLAKQSDNLELAEKLMRRSLKVAPDQPHVHNNLGNVLDALEKKAEAAACYRRAAGIKPDYAEAWYNLGVLLGETGPAGEAAAALGKAIDLRPGYAEAHNALGTVLKSEGRLGEALEAYRRALEIRPDYITALHNLGVILKMSGDIEEAIVCYRRTLEHQPEAAEAHYNLGNALQLVDRIDEAEACYRRALELRPEFEEAHADLNFLLWVHGRHDRHLESYSAAIIARPQALGIRHRYAEELRLTGSFAAAEEVLRDALKDLGPAADTCHLLARVLSGENRDAEALDFLDRSLALEPDRPRVLLQYAEALLKLKDPEAALEKLERARELDPVDQEIIAYQGMCWRIMGDEREAVLNDYERMVKVYELPLPEGYNDAESFNRDLDAALDRFHTGKFHPLQQTLRNGTQNLEALYDQHVELVQTFRKCQTKAVLEYISSLDDNPDHPFYARKTEDFRFTGSYTVRLRNQGYHTNHVHPEGWISSAYYVAVPAVVAEGEGRQGWINFGAAGLVLDPPLEAKRYVQPKVGVLALFPSYIWHGTVPFTSDEHRTTIVVDIVPKN